MWLTYTPSTGLEAAARGVRAKAGGRQRLDGHLPHLWVRGIESDLRGEAARHLAYAPGRIFEASARRVREPHPHHDGRLG
ncbi:MAG: hypothetical protein AAFZ18_40010, partial [Myxococcota bacterium]